MDRISKVIVCNSYEIIISNIIKQNPICGSSSLIIIENRHYYKKCVKL